jgi:hypothetical protein
MLHYIATLLGLAKLIKSHTFQHRETPICCLQAIKIPPLAPTEGAAMKSEKSEPRLERIILQDISVTLVS